ncbi:hypothetical protein AVEN_193395-1 [Araneus ventricosus]|uniref:Uncharacterized protein n=1 Tax=Araneus ventricosus TaxID=182803 RepID=A0A4Y2F8M6_ARAVE|nr:hypothetical protein AVEN_193395-1 [Araneus ventricosus]
MSQRLPTHHFSWSQEPVDYLNTPDDSDEYISKSTWNTRQNYTINTVVILWPRKNYCKPFKNILTIISNMVLSDGSLGRALTNSGGPAGIFHMDGSRYLWLLSISALGHQRVQVSQLLAYADDLALVSQFPKLLESSLLIFGLII